MKILTISSLITVVTAIVGCSPANTGATLSSTGGIKLSAAEVRNQTIEWARSNKIEFQQMANAPISTYIDRMIENTPNSGLWLDGFELKGLQDHLRQTRFVMKRRFGSHKTLASYLKAKKFNSKDLANFQAMMISLNGRFMSRVMNSGDGAGQSRLALGAPEGFVEEQVPQDGLVEERFTPDAPNQSQKKSNQSAQSKETQEDPMDSATCDRVGKASIGLAVASLIPVVGVVANFGGNINDAVSIAKGCEGGPGMCGILVDCNKKVSELSSIEYAATLGTLMPLPVAAFSDLRLKDITGDYKHGLEAVRKLHTVRFKYKKENPLNLPSLPEHSGFIAQELQKIIPEAVSTSPEGFLKVDFGPVHWAVVNAVQDLAKENEKLRADVRSLQTQSAALKNLLCAKFNDESVCAH